MAADGHGHVPHHPDLARSGEDSVPGGIATFGRTEADTEELFSVQRDYLYRTYPQARIFTLTIPGVVDVSSTDLRTMLAKGEGVNLLPPAVYGYILREGLYGTRADLKRLPLRELRPIALSYLKNKRIPHVLGTEQEAIRLAERYGADVEKARVAALLHDCTKKLNMEEQLELCGRYGIQLDELEQKALKLLHAKTGAAIARDVFGVDDEIYNAIWWHTTGPCPHDPAGKSDLSGGLYRALPEFSGGRQTPRCVL